MQHTRNLWLTLLAFIAGQCLVVAPARALDTPRILRPVVGAVENVGLHDADLIVKARIDTGAGLASINAEIVEIKHVGDKDRAVFRIIDKDGKSRTLERNIVEWVDIKNKGSDGSVRRAVVRMDFCLGGKLVDARANLASRGNFKYPILIGRNVLKTGNYMVDPTHTYISTPDCK